MEEIKQRDDSVSDQNASLLKAGFELGFPSQFLENFRAFYPEYVDLETWMASFRIHKTDEGRLVLKVPARGHVIPFEDASTNIFFLCRTSLLKHLFFSFDSILSLYRFADLVKSTICVHIPPPGGVDSAMPDPSKVLTFNDISAAGAPVWVPPAEDEALLLRIELHIFHPDELPGADELTEWAEIEDHHGRKQDAHGHLKAWMEAFEKLRRLPLKLDVRLCMENPFRSYTALRGETYPLREENVTLDVQLTESSWEKVPEKRFNMAMTKFALTEERMEDVYENQRVGYSRKEMKWLERHGTIGLQYHTFSM